MLLRLLRLGSRPMWYDEAFAVLASRVGLSGIIRGALSPSGGVSADVHPPLYFGALWAWMKIFGQSPFAVRLLNVCLSVLVMLVIWLLVKLLVGRKEAAVAVGLYAFSPFQVHYAQEARMYAMMSLFLLLATWAFWRVLKDGTAIYWIFLGISTALAVYTQVLAVVYLICLYSLVILLRRWDRLKEVIFASLIALAIYTPWLLQLPTQFNKVQSSYWIQRPGIVELIQTIIAFNSGLPLVGLWLQAGLTLSILLLTLLIWRSLAYLKQHNAHSQQLTVILVLAFGPVAVLFLISQVWPVYIIRGLLTSGVCYLLWIAVLLSADWIRGVDRGLILAVVVVLFGIGLLNHYQYQGFPYAPYETINAYISERIQADGVIVHSNKITMVPAYYYDEDLPHSFIADKPGSGSDTLAIPTQEVIGIKEKADIQSAVNNHKQIFFVIFSREIVDYEQAGVEMHPNLEYLNEHFKQKTVSSFGDVLVYEYQK
ncbi:MAG: glycosyltransferase family 39 protein [Anaerolineales bacterium]